MSQVQTFRAQAGLPPLSASALERLSLADPATLMAARTESAHLLLAQVSPRFMTAPEPLDAREMAVFKEAVREARAVVAEAGERAARLRDELIPEGRVDPAALESLYEGVPRRALLKALPDSKSAARAALRDLVLDGAPAEAKRFVPQLGLPSPQRLALRRGLEEQKNLPAVASLRRHASHIESQIGRGLYARAIALAREMLAAARTSGLREYTQRTFGALALALETKAKLIGAPLVYGRRPLDTGEKVRRQKHGDCAVQQLYNHPALAFLAGRLPYERFLAAVERCLGHAVRDEGMNAPTTAHLADKLGLTLTSLRMPGHAAGLAELLRAHGPLFGSVRWDEPQGLRDRHGNHAVVLREPKEEDGIPHFVTIDSNHDVPQLYGFDDLLVLSAGKLQAIQPKPGVDVEAAALDFIARYAPPPTLLERLRSLLD